MDRQTSVCTFGSYALQTINSLMFRKNVSFLRGLQLQFPGLYTRLIRSRRRSSAPVSHERLYSFSVNHCANSWGSNMASVTLKYRHWEHDLIFFFYSFIKLFLKNSFYCMKTAEGKTKMPLTFNCIKDGYELEAYLLIYRHSISTYKEIQHRNKLCPSCSLCRITQEIF